MAYEPTDEPKKSDLNQKPHFFACVSRELLGRARGSVFYEASSFPSGGIGTRAPPYPIRLDELYTSLQPTIDVRFVVLVRDFVSTVLSHPLLDGGVSELQLDLGELVEPEVGTAMRDIESQNKQLIAEKAMLATRIADLERDLVDAQPILGGGGGGRTRGAAARVPVASPAKARQPLM